MRRHKRIQKEAELDVTSFMNLMIVLVPALLINMVLSQLSVLDLRLPTGEQNHSEMVESEDVSIAVVIREAGFELTRTYKQKTETIVDLPKNDGKYDYNGLSEALQGVKKNPGFEQKRDISLLSEPGINYQILVTVMDTVRSYPAVVAASLVDATLFPEMSLGDAPSASGQGVTP